MILPLAWIFFGCLCAGLLLWLVAGAVFVYRIIRSL